MLTLDGFQQPRSKLFYLLMQFYLFFLKKQKNIFYDEKMTIKAIISLTEDLDLRNKIAENGYHLALQNFSNQAASRRWEEFYLALTKEKIN
jgi:hypothetical protein